MSLNQCSFIGNLGKDPELRSTGSGQQVASFTIACTEKWRDRNGQKQERTEWIDCTAWGKLAEVIGQYLTKGAKVYAQGRHERQSWDDKTTGEKKYRVHYVINKLVMLGGKPSGGNMAAPGEWGQGEPEEGGFGGGAPDEDDIPF